MGAIEDWGNDPRVLQYLSTHDPRGVVENGDYIRKQEDWGKTFEQLHPKGKHLPDAGLQTNKNPLPSGKLLNHPTLSNESPFAEGKGGEWKDLGKGRWSYTLSLWMQNNNDMNALKEYFLMNEKKSLLNLK